MSLKELMANKGLRNFAMACEELIQGTIPFLGMSTTGNGP